MLPPNPKEKIIIVDFGSQVTKLIARRIRDLGVFCEILTINDLLKVKDFKFIKGIVLSGGPSTVTKKKYLSIPKKVFSKKIPILGICYGLQLISKLFGGSIKSLKKKENLEEQVFLKKNNHYLLKIFLRKKIYLSG